MKRLIHLVLCLAAALLPVLPAMGHAAATPEPQVLLQLSPEKGDWWLALCADGQGGFYALSHQRLFRWQAGQEQLTGIAENPQQALVEIACRGDEVYAYSQSRELFRMEAGGSWQSLGLGDWLQAQQAPAGGQLLAEGGLALGKDRLFFFVTDQDQELHYLCSYDLRSAQISMDSRPVFAEKWVVHDAAQDRLLGLTEQGEAKDRHLTQVDVISGQILHIEEKPFDGIVRGLDTGTGELLGAGYEGATLGRHVGEQRVIPGTPKRLNWAVLVDHKLLAFVAPARGAGQSALCLLPFQ